MTNDNQAVGSSPVFCVGDRVTWMKTCKVGSGYSFSNREGKIIRIQGAMAVLQMRNGRTTWEMLGDLTKAGETNAVTKLFNAMAGESVKPTENGELCRVRKTEATVNEAKT